MLAAFSFTQEAVKTNGKERHCFHLEYFQVVGLFENGDTHGPLPR